MFVTYKPSMGPRIIPSDNMLLNTPIPIPNFFSGIKLTAIVACEVVMMEKLMPCNKRMQINNEIVAAIKVRGKKIAQQVVAISRRRLQSIISDIIPEKGRTARATRGKAARPIPITDSLQ